MAAVRWERVQDGLFVAIGATALVFFLGLGAFTLWQNHSGASSRIRVAECHQSGTMADCTGGPESGPPIDIQGADWGDVGKDVDVRVHRSIDGRTYGVMADPTEIGLFFGLACVGGIVAVGSLVRLRRRATRP